MRRRLHRLLTLVVVIGLFSGLSVAPVAAADIVQIGGDDGVTVGTDGIELGDTDLTGDSTVTEVTEGATGGSSGDVTGTVEGVTGSAGGVDSVTDGLGGTGVTDGLTGVTDGAPVDVAGTVQDIGAGDTGVESVTGSLPAADGGVGSVTDSLPSADGGVGSVTGSLPATDGGVESVTGSLPTGGAGAAPGGVVGTDLVAPIPFDSGVFEQLDGAARTDAVGPTDVPVGGEDAQVNVCGPLNPGTSDLPVGALPSVDDLPDSAKPPGVPTSLLTNDAVFGIVLGATPGACEVFDPQNPQVDPSNPPLDPDVSVVPMQFGRTHDGSGVVGLLYYRGTLDEGAGAPSITGEPGMYLSPEAVASSSEPEVVIDDGRNRYGANPYFRYHDTDDFQGQLALILLGSDLGFGGSCSDATEYQPDLSLEGLQQNPLGPCQYEIIGFTSSVGPSEVIGAIASATETGGEPPVNTEPLPTDELLNL